MCGVYVSTFLHKMIQTVMKVYPRVSHDLQPKVYTSNDSF